MKKSIWILVFVMATGLGKVAAQKAAVVLSDKTGWHKIGETTVNFKTDKDEIAVLGADRFAAIKFYVEDAPINLLDLEIYYDKGEQQHVSVRTPIEAGKESKTIDLNGGERNLKKVVFVYKTLPNRKDDKAHVEIWGKKTNDDRK